MKKVDNNIAAFACCGESHYMYIFGY